MEADISILRKPGHFYFALTRTEERKNGRTGRTETNEIRMSRVTPNHCRSSLHPSFPHVVTDVKETTCFNVL
jgi:hypothetical protein